jgi:hypothetical protein
MGIGQFFAFGDPKNLTAMTADQGIVVDLAGTVYMETSEEGYPVDPLRRLTHPAFAAVEGEGIFTYLANPAQTLNFHGSPMRRMETSVLKTIGGTILVRHPEVEDDVIISEVWPGGGDTVSMPAEQFLTLYNFMNTLPAIGEYLTWEPREVSSDSYQVELVDLTIGGTEALYRELRDDFTTRDGAYVTETVTLKFKVAKAATMPSGVITLAGR